MADGIADDSARPRIEHDGEEDESGGEPDVGEICHPELVGPLRSDRRSQVRVDGLLVIAVRRSEPCAYPVGRERMLTHDTRDSLVINHQATSPELVRDPSVSVGGELGQDVFDPNAQIRIGLLPGCPVARMRSLVEGAPRHVHEATSPSDGDAPGPEMIDGSAPCCEGRINALFFMTSSSIVS